MVNGQMNDNNYVIECITIPLVKANSHYEEFFFQISDR